ncbi:hypothetical protein P7C73_g4557, partial [Tremellales sp. Uapishka_1]
MSTHPFLTNQMPYLARTTSSASSSTSSISSIPFTPSHTRTPSTNTTTSLSPYNITALSTIAHDYTPTPTPTPTSTIDLACIRFMQSQSDETHLFGSVASRGSTLSREERGIRRRLAEEREGAKVEVVEVTKKGRRIGRFF